MPLRYWSVSKSDQTHAGGVVLPSLEAGRPVNRYLIKAIAVSIAWTLQRVMSAFHSAVRGGQLAGKGVVSYLYKRLAASLARRASCFDARRGIASSREAPSRRASRPHVIRYGYISVDHDETYADEVAGYSLAFLGLAFQIKCGFAIPFPFNLLFLPFTVVETFIVWTIM